MGDRIKLNEVIKELIMESHDEEGYLSNTKETNIIFAVRNAFSELIMDGKMNGYVTSLEIPISNGWKVELPQDYLRYVRIWGIDDHGGMHKMFIDGSMNDAGEFLLDERGITLLDDQGIPLKGTVHSINNQSNIDTSGAIVGGNFTPTGYGRQYNLLSGVETKFGQYKLNRADGIIKVANCPFENLVLDYIADPAHFIDGGYSSLYMPRIYKEAVKAFAYFNLIKRRRSNKVPEVEKQRAEKEHMKLTKSAQLKAAPSIQEWRQYLSRDNGLY